MAKDDDLELTFPHTEPPAEGDVIEVAPGILWLRLPLPMKLDHVNIYALDDGNSWTLIDTGFNSKRGRDIWTKLLAGPLKGKPVGRVIVTHHHPDHVGLAGWFKSNHGAEVWATRTAWTLARMLTLDNQDRPCPETLAFYRDAGMPEDIYKQRENSRPFNFADIVAPIPLGFRRIREGDAVKMAGRNWQVHIGHGHAPSHATFWSDDGIVLAGDQVLPGISPNLGVYPTEPDADPVGEWLESCTRFKAMAKDNHLVLPGHKLPFYGLQTRLKQLIRSHHGALNRLETHLAQPSNASDCFIALFKRKITGDEYGLALVEACAHLNHLHARGRVVRERGAMGDWQWRLRENEQSIATS